MGNTKLYILLLFVMGWIVCILSMINVYDLKNNLYGYYVNEM